MSRRFTRRRLTPLCWDSGVEHGGLPCPHGMLLSITSGLSAVEARVTVPAVRALMRRATFGGAHQLIVTAGRCDTSAFHGLAPESGKLAGRALCLVGTGVDGFGWWAVTSAALAVGLGTGLSLGEWRGHAQRASQYHGGASGGFEKGHDAAPGCVEVLIVYAATVERPRTDGEEIVRYERFCF